MHSSRWPGRESLCTAPGRTDAGVHALAQVASVTFPGTLDTNVLARALNAVLPPDVRVLTIERSPPISMHDSVRSGRPTSTEL